MKLKEASINEQFAFVDLCRELVVTDELYGEGKNNPDALR